MSEERFRQLVDAVSDYAIFILDANGHVASWNPGAERTKGYEAEEILGKHFSVFYTEEDRAAELPKAILETVRREGRFEIVVDGKSVGTLSLDAIERLRLHVGSEYDERLAGYLSDAMTAYAQARLS